jgi:hypothetical protein
MATTSPTGKESVQKSKQGDSYRCNACGMELKVSKEGSAGCSPAMNCCGKPMQKA